MDYEKIAKMTPMARLRALLWSDLTPVFVMAALVVGLHVFSWWLP